VTGKRRSAERPLGVVPRWVLAVLGVAAAAQIGFAAMRPPPEANAEALTPPPPLSLLRVAAAGEPIATGYTLDLLLQAYDNQPGISIPFAELDYGRVIAWLATILELDPLSEYPLLMAAQVYSLVPDLARGRLMLEFVHEQFLRDPGRRWRWLAHAAITAKHRLHDDALALRYARDITRLAPSAPGWARQMQIFILEDIGELDSAKILLGGLIESGEVKDERELHFLTERLKSLKNAEKPSPTSKK
jgi:hypothetical protein